MPHPRRFPALITLFALLALGACSALPPAANNSRYSPEELLQGERFGLQPVAVPAVDILAVNDDMRAFVRQHVPPGLGDRRKVELLLAAILDDGLRLSYNNFKTYTAQEAFRRREGNCMSFTNLFVALAREAGVKARFQEVEVPPTWAAQGDTWMFNLHINALVDLSGHQQVVDFNLEDYDTAFRRHVLSDREALARYYNNMGVHWMAEDDPGRALDSFRKAIALRPATGYFWTNLGTLYRRIGAGEAAESAYLQAIKIGRDSTAHSNLARYYEHRGQPELARYHRDQVELFRGRNPYYLLQRAEAAYAEADYDQAERLLRNALQRSDSRDHAFYRLLGLVYLQQ
ncbi:MAG: transglutaminase domain-containing protein [Parahaliea sp.]